MVLNFGVITRIIRFNLIELQHHVSFTLSHYILRKMQKYGRFQPILAEMPNSAVSTRKKGIHYIKH